MPILSIFINYNPAIPEIPTSKKSIFTTITTLMRKPKVIYISNI